VRGFSRGVLATFLLVASLGVDGCALTESGSSRRGEETRPTTPAASQVAADPVLSYDFDDLPTAAGAALTTGALRLQNAGSEPFEVTASITAGATLRSVADPGGGHALRFPAYAATGTPPAVVTISSDSVTDPLGPGTSSFTFGADFNLDKLSEGGVQDNGNNLMQRGLTDDPAQYKLQLDQGHASCRVAGVDGELVAKSDQLVKPATWYHLSCTRKGNQVTLRLGAFGEEPEPNIEVGATGAVYVSSETPLVLGGKATRDGVAVVSDSDQFNGVIDNVFLEVGEEEE
jgi:hypothetical protein